MVYEEYSPNYCTDLMAKDNEEKASTLAELGHRYRLSRSPLSGKRSMMVFDSLALPSKYQVVHKSTCQLSSSATFRGTNITASDESLYFEPEHPSFTMAALTAVGGTVGYLRARSIPSLVGGLTVSALYGIGGYRISQNQEGGYAASAAASALLVASSAKRALKFALVPMGLSGLGLLAGGYYVNKIYRDRVGY
ncbi:TMEM14-domain-containing protein [Cystobasidium minutum MCA 4210]|uniref:TMEM14-domain-containing protein n=1 Tax=Cystobasidium minutum MCA 4210 TaxID=1397322 RepID=UPI0034CD244E|eukprot:jgi/Rhomi1/198834/gm1.7048_g